jgi:transcriptional regulator with PAS, ATPase and Fis domain
MSDSTSTMFYLPQVALPGNLLVREFYLDVREGPDQGKSFGPLVPPIRVGSSRGNDVTLSDPTVSRLHCSIERGNDGPVIIDNASRNGTFLGSYRVREAFLSEGTLIRLGQTTLAVRISGDARPVEISARKSFGQLLGESHAMRVLFATLQRLANADVPVLVEGETGTGKELVARALHSESIRKDKPFVVVDCGAVAPTLVESELFGHMKGAFTGAESQRAGAFELADGGTIFLDEIGELPLTLQPKLLRVLETGMVKPLGAGREQPVSVRVVAATHRNLRQMVNENTFREDLYFRLAVLPVRIPPLRERLEDIGVLARHFLARALMSAATTVGPEGPELTPETLAILRAQPWPGNVRELRNVIERAVIIGEEAEVARGDLAQVLRQQGSVYEGHAAESAHLDLEEAKRRFEREYLLKLLARHKNDITTAAQEANIHPKSLQRLIRRHNLRDLGGGD